MEADGITLSTCSCIAEHVVSTMSLFDFWGKHGTELTGLLLRSCSLDHRSVSMRSSRRGNLDGLSRLQQVRIQWGLYSVDIEPALVLAARGPHIKPPVHCSSARYARISPAIEATTLLFSIHAILGTLREELLIVYLLQVSYLVMDNGELWLCPPLTGHVRDLGSPGSAPMVFQDC
jgi:hypothetical protein